MEIVSEEILIEDLFKDESIKQKHRKNSEFLKLALANIALSKKLNIRRGLTYDCSDDYSFNIRTPDNERIFPSGSRYAFSETRLVVASHNVFLKNNWIEVPVGIGDVVNEIHTDYESLTGNLKCGYIRNGLTSRAYSSKIFEVDSQADKIRPKYLPVKIEF
jgi:hypothetical protein